MLAPWKKSYDQHRQHIKNYRHYFADKGPSSQSYSFSSSHVRMWELDQKEDWMLKNWCFWTVVLEPRVLRVPWTARRFNQSILQKNQPWIFTGTTDALTEASILWPPDANNWLIGKDPDAKKNWWQEKEMTEDEMVGWHHRLNGREFEQSLKVGDGQGSLVCCSPWGHDWVTEQQMTQMNFI